MKILVTGGAGFIGSAVIRHLVHETDAQVVNVDKLTYAANLDSLSDVVQSDRYVLERADICDTGALERILREYRPDAIMHLAAESHVDRSIAGSAGFIQTNIVGTWNLLDVARRYRAELPVAQHDAFRFHHVSTDEVYGDLGDSDRCSHEADTYAPSSPYSASKAGADHLVRAWRRTYGLPVLLSHCSNNYGPRQFPEKLIPRIILNALDGAPLPVYGSGEQVRDWLYVEDNARALCMVLEGGVVGETYHVGAHNERRNIDVVHAVCDLLDALRPLESGRVSYRTLVRHVADRPGHDQRYALDATKIRRQLGWQPQEAFETGLEKTVRWYLDNPLWWKRIDLSCADVSGACRDDPQYAGK